MEEQQQVQRFLPHHVKIMKVALAMAIIRQKPHGVSGRVFTEQLALQFSQLQTDWRNKAVQLEQELLRTRQELLKCQLQSELTSTTSHLQPPTLSSIPVHLHHLSSSSSGGGGGGGIEPSQSDSEWQSSGYSSSCPGNSQCRHQDGGGGHQNGGGYLEGEVLEEDTFMEQKVCEENGRQLKFGCGERASNDMEEHPPVAMNGLEGSDKENQSHLGLMKDHNGALEERISTHMKFFSSVSSLVRVQHHFSTVLHSDLQVTLRDTALSAIKGLSQAIAGGASDVFVRETILENAAENIVATLQFPLMVQFEPELTDAFTQLLTALLEAIVGKGHSTKGRKISNSTLCSVVSTLCCLPRLFQFAVEGMIKHITTYAHTLTKSIEEDCSYLDPDMVDSVGVLLHTLELLLSKYDVSLLPDKVRGGLVEDLESSIITLTEGFPLFVYSLWRVTTQLAHSC